MTQLNRVRIRERLRTTSHEAMQHIKWMAQTVHQAYHQDKPGTWEDCPRAICASTKARFDEWRKEFLNLVEEAFQ